MEIRESLDQILRCKEPVVHDFYLRMFEQYPEAKRFFERTNVKRQAVMLTMALQVVVENYRKSYPATAAYLEYLGSNHFQRGIPREFYAPFRACLLNTLESFHGEQWDSGLANQWGDALDLTTNLMVRGYGKHVTI